MIRRLGLRLFSLVMFSCLILFSGREAWSEVKRKPIEGLQLTISSDKKRWVLGKRINLRINLKNLEKEAIAMVDDDEEEGQTASVPIGVPTIPRLLWDSWELWWVSVPEGGIGSGGQWACSFADQDQYPIMLEPEAIYTAILQCTFERFPPGRYILRGSYELFGPPPHYGELGHRQVWTGDRFLLSNPIVIDIVER